ncbi:MAG: DUF6291 domain-containing protein [Treponema berlinense]|uniref:DUF6291 domain-containing protein n=1 Tax=Treponema berlinense TaxID=225004 RepID=UPI0023EFB067|nr:DUF6291 domain-containing protein [Treponema berlinense]MDD5833770.1 DUF6291 domain-containing protein [Treponema berlinense]
MRESFVFHEDYICDLPADYKADFIRYTVEYGLYGQKPKIADGTLEMALWAKIARRIDAETERYQAISAKRREAANKRYAKATPPAAKNANADFAEEPKAKPAKAEPAKRTSFEKPTVEEIAAYCSERKNGIDPQAFFDFYESKGWKVGAVKMKDWRASVRTWEQRHKSEGGNRKAGGMWGNENEIPDEITDLF